VGIGRQEASDSGIRAQTYSAVQKSSSKASKYVKSRTIFSDKLVDAQPKYFQTKQEGQEDEVGRSSRTSSVLQADEFFCMESTQGIGVKVGGIVVIV
jgi:hypothetical protein